MNVGQREPSLLLRHLLPLVAVAVLAAPSAAAASGPDPAPSGARFAPDPAPTPSAPVTSHARTIEQVHAFVPPSTVTRATAPAVPPAPVEVKRHTPAKAGHRQRSHASHRSRPPVVRDVIPLAVDIPIGLGTVAESIRDDSAPALAALALLAAAATAVSGAGLVLAWSRDQRAGA